MKILECRRQCVWCVLEHAEFVMSLFLTNAARALSQNYCHVALCLLTTTVPPRSILWDWGRMRVLNLNSLLCDLLLLCFPVKVILFMCVHHENSSGFGAL